LGEATRFPGSLLPPPLPSSTSESSSSRSRGRPDLVGQRDTRVFSFAGSGFLGPTRARCSTLRLVLVSLAAARSQLVIRLSIGLCDRRGNPDRSVPIERSLGVLTNAANSRFGFGQHCPRHPPMPGPVLRSILSAQDRCFFDSHRRTTVAIRAARKSSQTLISRIACERGPAGIRRSRNRLRGRSSSPLPNASTLRHRPLRRRPA